MAQNYPKWPKNDARIYTLFPQFFLTEKAVPRTFSLLECMDEVYNADETDYKDDNSDEHNARLSITVTIMMITIISL